MQLEVKTILNAIQHFPGFVYQDIRLQRDGDERPSRIEIIVAPHGSIPAKCSRCLKPAAGYDRLPQRWWLFVPLWGIQTFFVFGPRWVHSAIHGVVGAQGF